MPTDSRQPDKFSFLTIEQVDDFFKKYDRNGDGVITKDELIGAHLHLAGPSTQTKSHANAHKVSSKAHAEPAKRFGDRAQKAPPRGSQNKASSLGLSREEIKEIFRQHDIDGDGFLDYGELTMAFGFLNSFIPFHKARNGLTKAGGNQEGLIGEAELDKLIDYAENLYEEK